MSQNNNNSNVNSAMNVNDITLSKSQVSKGAKDILEMTGTLCQVLKCLDGLYNKPLKSTDGHTTESYFAACGVLREVQKNGRKRGITPKTLAQGWHTEMVSANNELMLYRWKTAVLEKTRIDENGVEHRYFVPVYYKDYETGKFETLKQYILEPVAADKWSVNTILKGMKQKKGFEACEKRRTDSESNVAKRMECKLYEMISTQNTDGTITTTYVPVQDKNLVSFK